MIDSYQTLHLNGTIFGRRVRDKRLDKERGQCAARLADLHLAIAVIAQPRGHVPMATSGPRSVEQQQTALAAALDQLRRGEKAEGKIYGGGRVEREAVVRSSE